MAMRFYILPADQGTTTCVNFDHVTSVRVNGPIIELYFVGLEAPLAIAKSPTSLATVAKGMDLSDSSKELVSAM
jgi:hypothetical protein